MNKSNTIYLDPELHELLTTLKSEYGLLKKHVVHKAVVQYLKENYPEISQGL